MPVNKSFRPLAVQLLNTPQRAQSLTPADWDLLIRQARRADLLPRLAIVLEDAGELANVPEQPRAHLVSAQVFARRHVMAVRWEVEQILRALRSIDVPLILLKGAAYTLAGMACARGRLFHDVDIIVPRDRLNAVEQTLKLHGWASIGHDEYDDAYYRRWMHELPPLRHVQRKTVIDVHHAILPDTARIKTDSGKMIMAAVPLPDQPDIRVLMPVDMVLHSATHLFQDGELDHGLRDLVDLDALLREVGAAPGFWTQLVARAQELGLMRPLYYAVHYCQAMLLTPVPDEALQLVNRARPAGIMATVMDSLFGRALKPDHASCDDFLTPIARWLLYVRAHYLRMPWRLLVPHLLRKALKSGPAEVSKESPGPKTA